MKTTWSYIAKQIGCKVWYKCGGSLRVSMTSQCKQWLFWGPTELRDNTNHPSASDGLAQPALTATCETCNITAVDFAHFRDVCGQYMGVECEVDRIDVELTEDVFVTSFGGRRSDAGWTVRTTRVLAFFGREVVGSKDLQKLVRLGRRCARRKGRCTFPG